MILWDDHPTFDHRLIMVITSTFLPLFVLFVPQYFFGRFRTFSGRTDFRIVVSGANFDAESDFEVRLGVAPQKTGQISQKLKQKSRFFFFFGDGT